MGTLLWLLDKVCAVLADIGLLCLIVLLVAGDGMNAFVTCCIIGIPCAAVGAFVGAKTWKYEIAPFTFLFRNRIQLGQSLTTATIIWAGRFFLFPFVGAGIYYVIVG